MSVLNRLGRVVPPRRSPHHDFGARLIAPRRCARWVSIAVLAKRNLGRIVYRSEDTVMRNPIERSDEAKIIFCQGGERALTGGAVRLTSEYYSRGAPAMNSEPVTAKHVRPNNGEQFSGWRGWVSPDSEWRAGEAWRVWVACLEI